MDVEQCWDCGTLVSSGIVWEDKVVCLSCLYEEDEKRLAKEQGNKGGK